MQTLCKHYYKPRNSAVDISVSINVRSRNCEGFPTFAPQTPVNGIKYLAGRGKTFRAELNYARCVFQLATVCCVMGMTPPLESGNELLRSLGLRFTE